MLNPEILEAHEGIVQESDPLHLDLEDDEFVQVLDQRISDSKTYYEGKKLKQRQDTNLKYYLGEQLGADKSKLGDWQIPFVENVVYEGIRRIKPIATSRLPDMTVKSSEKIDEARAMTDLVNTDIKKRRNRKLLGMAHVQERLFFYAVIKARWNPELDRDGDYEFLNVYPQNIVWDHTCKTSNADDMTFVAESAELSVKEIMMMFPKSADKLIAKLGWEDGEEKLQHKLASKLKITEVWFHWYKDTKDPITNQTQWEKVNAVVWKYEDCVLGKMRNPYFDYDGKINLFSPEIKEKRAYTDEELYALFLDQGIPTETVYYNYFKTPRKPYFFMVYEPIGTDPISATTSIEQIIPFQDHINDEGRQIIEMNERSAGKPVFNSEALDKETIKSLDWRNHKQAITVNGDDINKVFTFAQMPAAPAQLYQSKEENRSIAFEMIGVNATTRGVKDGDQTLGEAQMFREADYGFIDDLVEETINEGAEWMAQWTMQFIRLFYTKRHIKDVIGKDGEALYLAITQDLVDDGMVVEVSASGVDKLMRKRLAMENQKMGVGDLLSYYEDIGADNPKERAYRAFLQVNMPQMYAQEYLVPDEMKGQMQAMLQAQAQPAPAGGATPPAGGAV